MIVGLPCTGTLFAESIRQRRSMWFEMSDAISIDHSAGENFSETQLNLYEDYIFSQRPNYRLGHGIPFARNLFGRDIGPDFGPVSTSINGWSSCGSKRDWLESIYKMHLQLKTYDDS